MMNATRYYEWIIALVALVLFSRVITHEHVLDDRALIPNHPLLQGPVDVRQILFGPYWANLRTQDTLYRPMTIGSLALDHWVNIHLGLPGDHPVVFRVTSILLHAGVSVLVLIFVRWLGLSPAAGLWSGLLFAALPIHTEAVAAAVNRSEMLALGFSLAFLIWFQRRWVLSGACLLLALLSKESAILMLPVALFAAVILHMRPGRILLRYALVYGGIVALWWMLRSEAIGTALQAVVMLDNPLALVPATQRILTALAVQGEYFRLQVIPMGLSSDYSYNQIPPLESGYSVDLFLFIALTAVGIWGAWSFRRTHPFAPFLVVSYFLMFGLTSNVFFPIGTIMAERLAYAPSLCLCVLGGWGLSRLPGLWMWRVGILLVAVYGCATWSDVF